MNSQQIYFFKKFQCIIHTFFFLFFSSSYGQILVPIKSSEPNCNDGIETFEKISGLWLPPADRIPLFSSTSGAITADCYNRCRSSSSCKGFWINYPENACFRVATGVTIDRNVNLTRPTAYYHRTCLQGDVCNKAWVVESIPSFELAGHDDILIRSVESKKRCVQLCVTNKKLPCRSADYWESRQECKLSREDRRTQPGSFVRASGEVVYLENSCLNPVTTKRRSCEWQLFEGSSYPIVDFSTRVTDFEECQKTCEKYGAFTCRSITFQKSTGLCMLSGSDVQTTTPALLKTKQNEIYAQRVSCLDMALECHGDSMVAKLKTHSPFFGKMYSSVLTRDCETFGTGDQLTVIKYPLDSCGIYKDENGAFVGNLVVQQHPLIQKRGDAAFRLVCNFPEKNRTLSHNIGFGRSYQNNEEGRHLIEDSEPQGSGNEEHILGIATSVINSTAKSPKVRLKIVDSMGQDVSRVALGDEIFLKIEVDPKSAYGIFATDLIAKSGTNSESHVLLDSRGCPEDPAIFPHLKYTNDGSKSLKQRFEAFKFTNDAVVRFQVDIKFCRSSCPSIDCSGEFSHGRRKRDFSDLMRLHRDIIVAGPLEESSYSEKKKQENNTHNGETICGPKNLLIAVIIGVCMIQVVIILFCTLCLCYDRRKKQFIPHLAPYRSQEMLYSTPNY